MYQDQYPRQMFQGNWSCADCGAAITELPFQPSPEREAELEYRDCHRKSRPARPAGGMGGGGFNRAPRQMFQVNLTCSSCGAAITELPFEPDPSSTRPVTCRDCHAKNRPQRSFGGGGYNSYR